MTTEGAASPTRVLIVTTFAGGGFGSAEVADRLHLPEGTVRNYLSEAMG